MDAFHSIWTAPHFALRGQGVPFAFEDFELLTLMLSALKWREQNGRIRLVCDRTGAAYLRSIGLDHLWNLGVEPLDEPPDSLDPFLFWAAGKLYALRAQTAPIVMIDTDFIVWEPLPELETASVAVIHREALDGAVYPPPARFEMDGSYTPDPGWDEREEACNTALCFLADGAFLRYYTDSAIDFMNHCRGGCDRVTGMVFAEQRLLAMCARKKGVPIHALADFGTLLPGRQTRFTHLWGYKEVLRRSPSRRRAFCVRCERRILRDFPQEFNTLRDIPALSIYLEDAGGL